MKKTFILDVEVTKDDELWSLCNVETGENGNAKFLKDDVALSERAVRYYIKKLTGQIFTILDASVASDRQLKSLKDVVRDRVANMYGDISNMCWGNQVNEHANKQVANMTKEELSKIETVSLEQVVGE